MTTHEIVSYADGTFAVPTLPQTLKSSKRRRRTADETQNAAVAPLG
jgi:hypothetical protein